MPELGLAGYSHAMLVGLGLLSVISGLARGFSGFGSALIFIPVASAMIGPRIAVPLLLVVDLIAAAPLIPDAWRESDRSRVGIMALGLLAGVPAGAYILTRADPLLVRWMIVVLITSLLVLLMSGWRYHGRPATPLAVAVGAAAGLFSGIAQVGGPPVILYWLGGEHSAKAVRANLVLFFAISSVLAGVSFWVAGLLNSDVIGLSLLTGPAYGLGLWLGARMFGLASEATFRRICYVLIAVAAVVSMPVLDGMLR
jgi:uncharacterized membrane protein YfcA